ncbi:hypothetical protein [Roseateles sp.]|uniref:hypothetical protein n=1 Tax=Roseateles sp. TaxID=1971397 RepID=UPI0031DB57FE
MPHSDPLLPSPSMSVLPPSRAALRAAAEELRQAAQRGAPRQPLAGLRVGLVCGDAEAELAARFKAAAQGLGAQVTLLDPARTLGEGAGVEPVARMLGRLYGAVACLGLQGAMAQRLTMAAAVPVVDVETVFAPLDQDGGEDGGGAEQRRWAAQAAVLAALG